MLLVTAFATRSDELGPRPSEASAARTAALAGFLVVLVMAVLFIAQIPSAAPLESNPHGRVAAVGVERTVFEVNIVQQLWSGITRGGEAAGARRLRGRSMIVSGNNMSYTFVYRNRRHVSDGGEINLEPSNGRRP